MARPGDRSGPARPDWPVQAAGTIESVVASIRAKSAAPLETVARAVVYGILLAVMGQVALVLLTIALVRALEVYLPVGGVWLPYLIVGGLLTITGLLLWSKRRPKGEG